MSYVLSLPPLSPLHRSFNDLTSLQSHSYFDKDNESDTGSVHHFPMAHGSFSAISLVSLSSPRCETWSRSNENTPPRARSALGLVSKQCQAPAYLGASERMPRKASYDNTTHTASTRRADSPFPGRETPQPEVAGEDDVIPFPSFYTAQEEFFDCENNEVLSDVDEESSESTITDATEEDVTIMPFHTSPPAASNNVPFRRWLSTLRKSNQTESRFGTLRGGRQSLDDSKPLPATPKSRRHKKSFSMSSSLGFIAGVYSASVTVAGTSIAPLSHRGTVASRLRRGHGSSLMSDTRPSLDGALAGSDVGVDKAAWLRAVQRRKILEELIATEESYIGDMKILMNVYFTLLVSVPTLSSQTRASIQQNVVCIVQLHEELLGELHKAVPHSEYCQSESNDAHEVVKAKHVRWHSVDLAPERSPARQLTRKLRHSHDFGRPTERQPVGLVADAKTAGVVAVIFGSFMNRFLAYEEYSAYYEMMVADLEATHREMPYWEACERGIEVLSKATASEYSKLAEKKKALSLADLLIKPIQRVLKYPLMFERLSRHTLVYDDPNAHAELEKVLSRLRDTAREVNIARDDPVRRRMIQTTWLLQDRLYFEDEIAHAGIIRHLGYIALCGVLHIACHGTDQVRGQYMICLLYQSCLLLAGSGRQSSQYHVLAAIGLNNARLEEPDNGKGLQCHTAPHTWKLVFESGPKLYEIMMSACSDTEEQQWRDHLRQRIAAQGTIPVTASAMVHDIIGTSHLSLRSLGPVFNQSGSILRRMSIQRAKTLGPKSCLSQVIIKNTKAKSGGTAGDSATSLPMSRSQSHLSAGHIPTLAPRRTERIRLEQTLSDVWTKEVLPYPGMSPKRPENPIRASANSVMRKLSMASIASNFSKRSASFTSMSSRPQDLQTLRNKTNVPPPPRKMPTPSGFRRPMGPPPPPVPRVNFHNAPSAFLPEDFELRDNPISRRQRLATLADVLDKKPEVPRPMPNANTSARERFQRRLSSQFGTRPNALSSAVPPKEQGASDAAFKESLPAKQDSPMKNELPIGFDGTMEVEPAQPPRSSPLPERPSLSPAVGSNNSPDLRKKPSNPFIKFFGAISEKLVG